MYQAARVRHKSYGTVRTGPPPSLTMDQIVGASLTVIADGAMAALTARRLAQRNACTRLTSGCRPVCGRGGQD
jgi:hypothetical protein